MQNGLANDTIGNSCKMTTVCRRVSKLLRYIQLPAFSATFSGKLNDKHLLREKTRIINTYSATTVTGAT